MIKGRGSINFYCFYPVALAVLRAPPQYQPNRFEEATSMRFAIKVFLFLFAIFTVAAAYPEPSHKPSPTTSSKAPAPTGKCKYGPPLCCETVDPASDDVIGAILELLGIVITDLTTICGTSCSTIDLTGIGAGSECNWFPVCCQENNWGGLLAIGCSPYSLSV